MKKDLTAQQESRGPFPCKEGVPSKGIGEGKFYSTPPSRIAKGVGGLGTLKE